MLTEWWSEIRFRLRAVFARKRMDAELDEEVRFHLEREAEKLERAGFPRGEAWRRARLAFGGVDRVKEESRDGRGIGLLDHLGRDLRFAIRGLRRRPGFAVAVITTLGLGVGANAAMFGVVDRLMFRAPTYPRDLDRVNRVLVTTTADGRESTEEVSVYTRYLDLRRWATTIDQAAGFATRAQPAAGALGTARDGGEFGPGSRRSCWWRAWW